MYLLESLVMSDVQACVWRQHEEHINAITPYIYAETFLHSHFNIMSALLRQQVDVSAMQATSIHLSLPNMPCKLPYIQNMKCSNITDNQYATRRSFSSSARWSDVTLEAAKKDQAWRHCIEISTWRGLFVFLMRTQLYRVFTMICHTP